MRLAVNPVLLAAVLTLGTSLAGESPPSAGAATPSHRSIPVRANGRIVARDLKDDNAPPAHRRMPTLELPRHGQTDLSGAEPAAGDQSGASILVASAPATVVQTAFAGLSSFDDAQAFGPGIEPPDPWVAAGKTAIVQSVNSLVRITDRAGSFKRQVRVATFFGVLADQLNYSDPRFIYDGKHDRWIASILSYDCTNGYLYLAVSATGDPLGAWNRWAFTYPGQVPDYPGLGSSDDKIVISANEFAIDPLAPGCIDGSFSGGSLLVVDWAAAQGIIPIDNAYFADPGYFAWRPAANLTSDAGIYVVGERTSDGDVTYAKITGSVANANDPRPDPTPPKLSRPFDIGSIAPFTMPVQPRQPGSPGRIAQAVDERPTDAVWSHGTLWFVSTFPRLLAGDSATRDTVRVTQITTAASPTVRQDFTIGAVGFDSDMGGIGIARDGTAYFVYSSSSTTADVSTRASLQVATDAVNTYRPPVVIATGAGTYQGQRWGDYVGVAQDPSVADAVWTADEYANASGTWSTKVSMLRRQLPPGAPTTAAALKGNATATVSWRAPAWNGGSLVTGYTVTSAPDARTCTTTGTLSCTVAGLTNRKSYTFSVKAKNANGTGPASSPSAAVTPVAPPTASVGPLPTYVTSRSLHVTWAATAGSGAVTTFDVRYRRATWNGSFGSYVSWLTGTTLKTAALTGSAGATYCFSVRAHDALGSVSGWTADTCTGIPLDDRSMWRYGTWTSGTGSGYYEGTYRRSTISGNRLVRTGVVARRLAIVATTCSTCGSARVYWGSTLLRTISLYSSTTMYRRVLNVTTFTTGRIGTVTIRVYGSGKRVVIDGLAIRRL